MTSPNLPSLPLLDIETSRGKRTTQLDLNVPSDAAKLRALVSDGADVFLQSYRPGGLTARGFSPEACAAMRPGIVHASIAAFSPGGPWKDVKSVRGVRVVHARKKLSFPLFAVRLARADAWRV